MKIIFKRISICLILFCFSFLLVSCKKDKIYSITYQLDGGHFDTKPVTTFTSSTIPDNLPIPTKDGYNFLNWEYNNQIVNDFASILDNNTLLTLTAKWEKMKPYLSKDYLNLNDEAILYVSGHLDSSNLNITISSDVISIDKWLTVKALKIGKATITISEKNSPDDITMLNIEVIEENPTIVLTTNQTCVGGKIYFNIVNFDQLSDFTWSVDNDIASINDDYSITGLSLGSFNLIATSKLDSRIFSSTTIDIVDENTSCVFLTEDDRYIFKKGEVISLSIKGRTDYDSFTWICSNTDIIRVGENYEILAVDTGTATVNVYENNNSSNRTYFRFTIVDNDNDVDYIGNFLSLAFSQVGYTEKGENDQKYGEWYGNNKQPWCAMFVSWCWYFSGLSNELLLKYQGCSTGQEWCIEKGIFHYKEEYTPKPGDIIFFTSAGMGHTGICAYVDGNYMYTIEGNSSNKVGIWRWSLKDARITGYASPNYPTYNGTVKDFSFLAGKDQFGNYYWTNVSEKQNVA